MLRRFFYTEIQCLSNALNIKGAQELLDNDVTNNSVFQLDSTGPGKGKYKLREGWQLHLYISQLPCKFLLIFKKNMLTIFGQVYFMSAVTFLLFL